MCVDIAEPPARRPGTNITNQVNSRSTSLTKSSGTSVSKPSVGGNKTGGDTGSKGWFLLMLLLLPLGVCLSLFQCLVILFSSFLPHCFQGHSSLCRINQIAQKELKSQLFNWTYLYCFLLLWFP